MCVAGEYERAKRETVWLRMYVCLCDVTFQVICLLLFVSLFLRFLASLFPLTRSSRAGLPISIHHPQFTAPRTHACAKRVTHLLRR